MSTGNESTITALVAGPGEGRVFACLDRSSSMRRFDKYALVASLYPKALCELAGAAPGTWVETWWFARDVTRYSELAPVSEARYPSAWEYARALAGGSAISDCILSVLSRAKAVEAEWGDAPTRIVLWTDGWNRHARHLPAEARAAMAAYPEAEVYLIGFVDSRIRARLDRFVAESGLPPGRVMIFEHEDDPNDTHRAAYDASAAFGSTIQGWQV